MKALHLASAFLFFGSLAAMLVLIGPAIWRFRAWKRRFPELWQRAALPTGALDRVIGNRHDRFECLLRDPALSDPPTASAMRRFDKLRLALQCAFFLGAAGMLAIPGSPH